MTGVTHPYNAFAAAYLKDLDLAFDGGGFKYDTTTVPNSVGYRPFFLSVNMTSLCFSFLTDFQVSQDIITRHYQTL